MQTAVFGFAGLLSQSDRVALDQTAKLAQSLGFGLQWRNRRLKIKIDQGERLVENGP